MKKKISSILIICALALSMSFSLFGCTPSASDETDTIVLAGLKGPTSMGMVFMLESDEDYLGFKLDATIYGSADEVTPKLLQGEIDLAMIPANLASVLYNKTEGAIQVLAINTLGVLYIVETEVEPTISSFADLKGKTIYCTGKGSTPEYTLRYLLTANGLDPDTDVNLEFKSEPTEVVAILKTSGGVAMLPQPYVAVAQSSVDNLNIVLDLNEAWSESCGTLVTGVLVGRTSFINANPNLIQKFLEQYEASINMVVSNHKIAATYIEKAGIVKSYVAERALPYCNITYIAGEDMEDQLSGYLATLYQQNPAAVGGKLPGVDFYYE